MEASGKIVKMPCPAATVWAELAAGQIQGDQAETLSLHASQCRECAALLKSVIEALEQDEDEDEAEQLDAAEILSIARKAASPRKTRRIIWGAAAVASLAVIALLVSRRGLDRAPMELLVAAAGERRSIEVRFVGAAHATILATRGREDTTPPQLFEAQAIIGKEVQKGNSAAVWIHAKGLAELLRGDAAASQRSLQIASDMGENSSEFWNNYGNSYYQLGKENRDYAAFSRAIELYTKAIQMERGRPEYYFNRALAYSELSLIDSAITDLEMAREYEKSSEWRRETEERLEKLRQKRGGVYEGRPESPSNVVEAMWEKWLRGEVVVGKTEYLAKEMERAHGDVWMREWMEQGSGAGNELAVDSLREMARIRSKSRREAYAAMEARIQELRRARLGAALGVWRDFELLVRESNRQSKRECLAFWEVTASSPRKRYRWFEIQMALEISTCLSATRKMEEADRWTQAALTTASEAGYKTAMTRAEGFWASHLGNEGRYREAMAISARALERVLRAEAPLDRAHQHYRNLAVCAERLGRLETAHAAAWMATATAKTEGLTTMEVYGWLQLAEISQRQGRMEKAWEELSEGERIAAALPEDFDVRQRIQYAKAMLAGLNGDIGRMLELEADAMQGGNAFLHLPHLTTLAELEYRQGDIRSAKTHAERALALIEGVPGDPRRFRSSMGRAYGIAGQVNIEIGNYGEALRQWRAWAKNERGAGGSEAPETGAKTVLSLTVFGGRLGVFLAIDGALHFAWSESSEGEALRHLRQLRGTCSNFRFGEESWASAAQALDRAILPESLAKLLAGREEALFIEATGEWMTLPYGMLRSLNGKSVSYWVPGRKPTTCGRWAGGFALAIADRISPELRPNLASLPGLEIERRALRKLQPELEEFTGAELTPAKFSSLLLSHRWVHFSGHAQVEAGDTALVLAPDAKSAKSEEKQGLWIARPERAVCSDLIFFAACSTARWHDLDTIRASQMAEAVVMRGAKHAIATLWEVDSTATTEFAKAFYKAMGEGGSPQAALSQAAKELRQDVRFQHPYYWAAFVLLSA